MYRVVFALDRYRREQADKLAPLGDRAEGRLAAMHDKCDCLLEFLHNSSSVAEARQRIETIFADDLPGNAVVLGTVHRTKGLESERVFVLAPDLIPHPMAKKPWERDQEKNLAWVAATRAKFNAKTNAPGTLIFCGPTPAIYGQQAAAQGPLAHLAEQPAHNGEASGSSPEGSTITRQGDAESADFRKRTLPAMGSKASAPAASCGAVTDPASPATEEDDDEPPF